MASAQGNGAHTVRFMPPELLAELLRGPDADSVQVVDVRDDDFGDGCVAGAWNVPSKSLQTEPAVDALIHQLAREQRTTVVVHCLYSQQRGPACAARLVERLNAGVSGQLPLQVCVLQGGWMNWRKTYGEPCIRRSRRRCQYGRVQASATEVTRRELLATSAAALVLASPPSSQAAFPGAAASRPADRVAAYVRFIADQESRGTGPLVPDFPPAAAWFNSAPLSFSGALAGRVVVLDFWTLCCVNCMHVLPELAALETKYASAPAVAVVGVHSPKFSSEKYDESIRAAVLRFGVSHPVVNDAGMTLWRALDVQSWPTLGVVGPTGRVLALFPGEGKGKDVDDLVAAALKFYGEKGMLTQTPLPLALERDRDPRTLSSPLSFPGKLCVDSAHKRLFIADSGHHRIVVTDLQGKFMCAIGGDAGPGLVDGSFGEAAFNRPQGVAYDADRDVLYLADTENHALRAVQVAAQRVTTLVGDGIKGRGDYRGGGSGASQRLNSPWDVVILPGGDVAIAIAGQHQLWRYSLADGKCTAFSGDGYEQNGNGLAGLTTSWAQPSGLSLGQDGNTLFVADSESSSIRACSLSTGGSTLLVGGDALYADNLFRFGDVDGRGNAVKLQHPLAVAVAPASSPELVYIADSYNHRIKVLDVLSREVTTVAGTGKPGPLFEPSGLAFGADGQLFIADTNNGLIKVLDTKLVSAPLRTLELSGVPLPKVRTRNDVPMDANMPPPVDSDAVVVRAATAVSAARGSITATVNLPQGFHLTEGAGSDFAAAVFPPEAAKIVDPATKSLGGSPIARVAFTRNPGASPGVLRIACRVFYCQTNAVCLFQSVVFDLPLAAVEAASVGEQNVALQATIRPPTLSQSALGGLPDL